MTMASLKALIEAVARIDAPKTLVLLTEGFLMADRLIDVQNLGSLAAAARTSIYALRLDEVMFSDVADRRVPMTRVEDRQETRVGVETLANAARGSLFNITVAADNAFARIEAEISGYYLLGVESVPTDKDGKPHPIEVSVRRSGTLVRSRRQVMTAGDLDHPRTPREAVMGALGSPMMLSTLPLIVAAFPLQGPDPAKVQLLLHASVGTDYTASKLVTFAYTITDAQGRIIESLGGDSRLNPLVNGVPSALQFDVTSSLPPGEYTVKLAVSESELVGSVEHVVQARLIDAAPVRLSDFIVGGPAQPGDLPRPTIGYVARFGNVHGYLEAYGPAVETLGVRYEVAADAKGPPLVSEEIQGRAAGPARTIFSKALLVRHLPPGKYVLRAILSTERGLLRTIAREFLLAGPPVLMTSATVSGGAAAPAVVYLPVKRELLSRAFRPEEALRPETVRAFRERVAPAARTTFDDGIALMSAKDYAKAERTFRIAIRTDTDSTAAMAYLGAVFAAAGYDTDAVSTWQTALVDGSDFPELYQWLGDTLMRTRNLGEARGLLEEAAAKWPSDLRFARPLSFLYATFGQGREALRTLTRYLSSTPNDLEALLIAVQWMYELHQTGAAAETRSEDVKTARGFASAYEKAKGPQTALVRQWMAFLEKPQK
jgi:tetratricopeptide (TPR) repeat protein